MPTMLRKGFRISSAFCWVHALPTQPNTDFTEIPKAHGVKFPSVLEGYLVSMNILPRKEAGYYAYSLIVGEKLCLLVV
jgi:hypothetical protein